METQYAWILWVLHVNSHPTGTEEEYSLKYDTLH